MAIKKEIEIVANTEEAEKNVEGLNQDIKELDKTNKDASKSASGIGTAFRGVGTALKAIGIGAIIALFAKLVSVLSSNQKVIDFFSTSMEALTIAFNDLFSFVSDNIGKWVDNIKSIFENPTQAIKDFGDAIEKNIIERFTSLLDTFGHLGNALKKLFDGDFAGAFESVKAAGKESIDIFTGVNNTVDKVVDSTSNYVKETINAAKANVELKNTAQLAAASQSRLVEQYDRLAEKQRQVRDEERNSVDERIKANDELGRVLEEQEKAMLRLADLQIAATQATLNTNNNIENQVALIDALANKEAILAQVEGFRSEQLVNDLALKRELIELDQTITDAEKERQLAQLEFNAEQEQTELGKLEKQRERLDLENEIIEEDLERKRELFAEGTQVRVDAEQEYLTKKQEIDNEITANEKAADEEKLKSSQALEEGKIQLAQSGLQILGSLAKEGSALAKGVAVSQAIISTYQGINKALAETTDFTPTQTLRFANAAAVGVAGFLNVAKILSTNESGASAGSAATPQQPTSAPSFNLVGGTGANQIAQSIGSQNQPIEAFVVSSNVTSSQELDRNIEGNASL